MRVQPLSLVAKIKPGEEEQLREILSEVGANPATNRYIRLSGSTSTHLANWVILHDPEYGSRLFFTSNYDGDLESYVLELRRVGPGIDEIFGRCEGFAGSDQLFSFVKKHSYKSQTFFAAFPNETVGSVRSKIAIREQIEAFLNMPDVAAFNDSDRLPVFLGLLEQLAGPKPRDGLERFVSHLRQAAHDRFFSVVEAAARWYGQRRVDSHFVSVASNLNQPLLPSALSDSAHMTNLIDVRPGFRIILRLSLAIMEFLARYAYPPGDLAGVTTIHFARWIMIDDGRRLLFQSKFDGTWENYMGDFVDKIAWGLDAIWSNTVGYPSAGMNDIDAFKRFIRDRQFEHLAVYEAYPLESVLGQMRDREISDVLAGALDAAAVREVLHLA